jgi:RNA polymerase sigma-70 factor (ECF subfamily)
LRLPEQLAGRLDPSDVVQEVFREATERYDEYRREPKVSPYRWLRFLTLQRLLILYRQHVQTRKRTTTREVLLPDLSVSSIALAKWLVDTQPTPRSAVMKDELKDRLHKALEGMAARDREILTLRHFEQLSNVEAAEELGITPAAASQRYYRALLRLGEIVGPLMDDESAH